MLFLKNFLLLILYLSDQHRLRLHISQKVPESIDLQNYDNESVLAIVIQPMVNYSSTSVRSLMINTTGSTPELTTVHIGIRNNVYDSNNYNSFRENNSRTDQKSVTVDDKYVQHIDIDAMRRDDPRVYGENNVTTQKPTDYDHNTTKNDSTDECYDSFEQDNSKNDQESVIVHDEHKYDPFMFIDIDAMQGDDPRVYGENNVTTQTPADYDQNITKNDSSTDDYYDSFREDNARNDQESVTVLDEQVYDIDIDAMQGDDPRVYGENNVTTQKPTDYDHNTTKNDSTDECNDSFKDNSSNDQESVTVHDEHVYDIDIDAMQGDDPRVYGENNVTTQKPTDYDHNTTKNDSTDECNDSFKDNSSNDHESVTVHDEQVYDIDIDAMQGDDPRVYGENNMTTQIPADYDHNTTKNDSSTDDYYDSFNEDNSKNDQESVTVHDEHVYDLNINAMPGDDPTVYGENNVTTQKPTDYDHNSTKNDSSTDECYNSRNNQKSGNDYYEHLAYFRKLIQNSISKSNSPKQTGSEEIYNEIDEILPVKDFKKHEIISDAFLNISIKYSTVMFNHSENIVTSPISAMILMFMGSYGACSCTKDTINLAPNLPAGIRRDRVPIKSFIQELNLSKPNGTLMGHKIFIADNVVVSKKFSEILEQVFKSKLQQIDFTNALEAAQLINNWSANQTNDSITNVVDPYQFNNETGLVLISVASFNCQWLKPFNPNNTKLMDFSVNGENKKVWTMNQRNTFHYGILKDFNSTYIMLPLKGNPYREPVKMIIILPDKQTNLSNILSNFSTSEFRSLMNNTDNKVYVRISLPKFEIKSKINLKDKQQTMGIEIIFSDDANFRRITKSRYLKVNDFIQESVMHVDEGNYYNSERSTNYRCNQNASVNSVSFHVNRPFIVLIANDETIFASAQVMDPN